MCERDRVSVFLPSNVAFDESETELSLRAVSCVCGRFCSFDILRGGVGEDLNEDEEDEAEEVAEEKAVELAYVREGEIEPEDATSPLMNETLPVCSANIGGSPSVTLMA